MTPVRLHALAAAVIATATVSTLAPSATSARTASARTVCHQSAEPGPPPGEPFVSKGPTELISGLFLDGGPPRRSAHCRRGIPAAGTIVVRAAGTEQTLATRTVANGHLAVIALAPGSYSITGTFADALSDGRPIQTLPIHVTIPAHRTVRQDVTAAIH